MAGELSIEKGFPVGAEGCDEEVVDRPVLRVMGSQPTKRPAGPSAARRGRLDGQRRWDRLGSEAPVLGPGDSRDSDTLARGRRDFAQAPEGVGGCSGRCLE